MCIAASYGVVLILELSRILLRVRLRPLWLWLGTGAGLLAHSTYLALRAQAAFDQRGVPLSNWYDWCLVGAWALAVIYLLLSLSRPVTSMGLFLLPLVLALLALARQFPANASFRTDQATIAWGMVHGVSLLVGTVTTIVGFSTGIMYIMQANRLKRKKPPSRLQLPSLEWLEIANDRCLTWSVFWLTAGLLSGVILNLAPHSQLAENVSWTDPTVLTSAILQVWLVVVAVFGSFYRPARVGRKVAYLTVANFVILTLTLGVVLFSSSQHAKFEVAGTRGVLPGDFRWGAFFSSSIPTRAEHSCGADERPAIASLCLRTMLREPSFHRLGLRPQHLLAERGDRRG